MTTEFTLLELMKRRRALPLHEALILLERVAALADARFGTGRCVSAIELGSILIAGDIDHPISGRLSVSLRHDDPDLMETLGPDATIVPDASVGRSSAEAIARLAYEVLGGINCNIAFRFTPLAALSAGGNNVLREAMEKPHVFGSARAVLEALRASGRAAAAVDVCASMAPPVPIHSDGRAARRTVLWILVGGAVAAGVLVWRGMDRSSAASPVESPPQSGMPTPPSNLARASFLLAAEEAKMRDDFAAAVENFSLAHDLDPSSTKPRDEMEMLAARLRANPSLLDGGRFAAIRPALEKAARRGVVSAQMILGETLRESDPRAALDWFAQAAAHGQTEAMTQAGLMVANGLGVGAPNYIAAAQWFQQGAEGGDTDAMVSLADCYLRGKGIAPNTVKAIELLRAAAALHHPAAMNMLGDLYNKGLPGVLARDPHAAYELISRAARMGYLDAQANLGVLLVNGVGTAPDRARAFALWRDGAQRGNATCMYFYAQALEDVDMPSFNPVEARKWYSESARLGNTAAAAWCRRHGIRIEPRR